MIRQTSIVVSICIAPLLTAVACAGQADDELKTILERIRNVEAEIRRMEKEIVGLLFRLDAIERRHAASLGAAAPTAARRSLRQDLPLRNPPDSVGEVLRLQFRSPSRLLDGIHEREERLRRRQFPPEIYLMPIRN